MDGDDEGEGELVTCSNNVTFTHTHSLLFFSRLKTKKTENPTGKRINRHHQRGRRFTDRGNGRVIAWTVIIVVVV